jgi:hypothetical protein
MRSLLAVALILAACGGRSGGVTETTIPASAAAPARGAGPTGFATGVRFGVAGLIPPHFGSATAADYETMYRSFAPTGGSVGVYTNWYDSADKAGAVPLVVPATIAASRKYAFGPVIVAFGVAKDAGNGRVVSTVNWSSPERERFLEMVTAVARDYGPEFIALGVEVNRLWASDPVAFEGFVKGYADAQAAIKKVAPSTKVFTVFQLELLRGGAYLTTGQRSSPAQWDLVARFGDKLDLVGFTTYPFLQYASPAEVPADYYTSVAQRLGRSFAFTEIGWPSARPASIPAAYAATPADQAAFVERFFTLTGPVPTGPRSPRSPRG